MNHSITLLDDSLKERFRLTDQAMLLGKGFAQFQAFHPQPVVPGGFILLNVEIEPLLENDNPLKVSEFSWYLLFKDSV